MVAKMHDNWMNCTRPWCMGQTRNMAATACPVCGGPVVPARPLDLVCQKCKTSVPAQSAPPECPQCGGFLARQKPPEQEKCEPTKDVARDDGIVGIEDFCVANPSILGTEPAVFFDRYGRTPEEVLGEPWKLDRWLSERGLPTLRVASNVAPKKKRKAAKVDANEIGRRSEEAVQRLIEARGGTARKTPTYQYMCRYSGIMKHASTDVDLDCDLHAIRIPIEVKGISIKQDTHGRLRGDFKMKALGQGTKERGYLNRHLENAHPCVALLWWDVSSLGGSGGKCDLMHLIPWRWWVAILEPALLARASGNFKGRSLRYHADIDLIERWEIRRNGTSWDVSETEIVTVARCEACGECDRHTLRERCIPF